MPLVELDSLAPRLVPRIDPALEHLLVRAEGDGAVRARQPASEGRLAGPRQPAHQDERRSSLLGEAMGGRFGHPMLGVQRPRRQLKGVIAGKRYVP
jgi:hypothetical protein